MSFESKSYKLVFIHKKYPYAKLIRNLLFLLSIDILVSFSLAIYFYPEKFELHYFFSYLGEPLSIGGLDNSLSQIIYRIGLIVSDVIALGIACIYWKKGTKLNILKGIFLFGFGMGTLFLFFPLDGGILQKIHRIGSVIPIFIFCFIFLAQFVRYENDSYSFDTKESRKLTFDKLFFIISIIAPLIYFIVYLMHNEILSAYMQKITLSLMLVSIFFLDYEDV